MKYFFYGISLLIRDMGRLFLGIGEQAETARLPAKERRDLGLPYQF